MKTVRLLMLSIVLSAISSTFLPGLARAQDPVQTLDDDLRDVVTQLDHLLNLRGEAAEMEPDPFPMPEEKQAKFDRLQDQSDQQGRDLDVSTQSLREAEQRIAELEGERRQMQQELDRVLKEDEATQSLVLTEDEDLKRLEYELVDVRNQLLPLSQALEEAKAENVSLRAELEIHRDAGDGAVHTAELKARIKEIAEIDEQRKAAMDDLFRQIAGLRRELSARDEEIEALGRSLEETTAAVAERDRQRVAHDAQLTAKDAVNEDLNAQLERAQMAMTAKERELGAQADELETRSAELQTLRQEKERVLQVDEQRRRTLDETLSRLAAAEQNVAARENSLGAVRAELAEVGQSTSARLEALTARNVLLEGEIVRMEKDEAAAKADRDAAQGQVDLLRAALTERDRHVVDIEAQVSRLTAVDEQRRKAMDRILLDVATLEQDKASLHLDVQRLKTLDSAGTAVQAGALEGALAQAQADNKAMLEQVEELHAALKAARTGMAVRQEVPDVSMDRDDVEALDALDRVHWQAEKHELVEQMRTLEESAARDTGRIEALNSELEQVRQAAADFQAQVQALEGRKTDVRETDLFKDLEQINQVLREKLVEIESDRQRLAATATAVEEIQAKHEATLSEERLQRTAAEKKLGEILAREDEYKELIERLVPEVSELERQVVALTRERQVLANRMRERDEDMQSLKVELDRREHRLAKAERVAEVLEKARSEVMQASDREKLNMHYNMAAVYAREGKFLEAEQEYLQALRIDPADADVHYNLGILYDDELKTPTKAVGHYRRYLQINPHGPDADRVRNWLMKLEMQRDR